MKRAIDMVTPSSIAANPNINSSQSSANLKLNHYPQNSYSLHNSTNRLFQDNQQQQQ